MIELPAHEILDIEQTKRAFWIFGMDEWHAKCRCGYIVGPYMTARSAIISLQLHCYRQGY